MNRNKVGQTFFFSFSGIFGSQEYPYKMLEILDILALYFLHSGLFFIKLNVDILTLQCYSLMNYFASAMPLESRDF